MYWWRSLQVGLAQPWTKCGTLQQAIFTTFLWSTALSTCVLQSSIIILIVSRYRLKKTQSGLFFKRPRVGVFKTHTDRRSITALNHLLVSTIFTLVCLIKNNCDKSRKRNKKETNIHDISYWIRINCNIVHWKGFQTDMLVLSSVPLFNKRCQRHLKHLDQFCKHGAFLPLLL